MISLGSGPWAGAGLSGGLYPLSLRKAAIDSFLAMGILYLHSP